MKYLGLISTLLLVLTALCTAEAGWLKKWERKFRRVRNKIGLSKLNKKNLQKESGYSIRAAI